VRKKTLTARHSGSSVLRQDWKNPASGKIYLHDDFLTYNKLRTQIHLQTLRDSARKIQ